MIFREDKKKKKKKGWGKSDGRQGRIPKSKSKLDQFKRLNEKQKKTVKNSFLNLKCK